MQIKINQHMNELGEGRFDNANQMSDLDISKLITIESKFYNIENLIVDYLKKFDKILDEIDRETVYLEKVKKCFTKLV